MILTVHKMSGAGNLFSVIDNRQYNLSIKQLKKIAPHLCKGDELPMGITEGLIAINHSEEFDFIAEFMNPDGSYGAMCGNGGRCAVHFANSIGLLKMSSHIKFFMADSEYRAEIIGNKAVSLRFPPPKSIKNNIKLNISGITINIDYVDIGSHHAIINYDELNLGLNFREFDINSIGSKIRFHKSFQPNGVNVNFFKIENTVINLRTYERGVEAETGACGTGTISTAVICADKFNLSYPIEVIPPSREKLFVNATLDNKDKIKYVFLIGPAEIIGKFEIEIPDYILI